MNVSECLEFVKVSKLNTEQHTAHSCRVHVGGLCFTIKQKKQTLKLISYMHNDLNYINTPSI